MQSDGAQAERTRVWSASMTHFLVGFVKILIFYWKMQQKLELLGSLVCKTWTVCGEPDRLLTAHGLDHIADRTSVYKPLFIKIFTNVLKIYTDGLSTIFVQ